MPKAPHRARWIAWCSVLLVALTSCSAGLGASSSVVTATVTTVAPPPATGTTDAASSAATSGSTTPTPTPEPTTERLLHTVSSQQSTSSSTRPPGPVITMVPADNATGFSPIEPVVIRATTGTLDSVVLLNPEGEAVEGKLNATRTAWTTTEPLGYNRRYAATATAANDAGKSTLNSSFTTLKPKTTVFPSFYPPPSTKVVGVGQPMVVIFDKAPKDRAAAEKTLSVTAEPATQGAWYWWDDRTVHWRPKDYWKPGTKVTVTAKVYGVEMGPGMYGETDRTLNVTIGSSKIAVIDDKTKQMDVFIDGKRVRTVPVSLGMDKAITVKGKEISFVTPSGTYVAQEKYKVKQMSSASYGLPVDYDLGYDSKIPLATRLSYSGIFIHSAPWSVKDQGVRNVSHGCININPTDGKWFYDTFGYGDIVTVKGTSAKLGSHDGFGDWNIPWEQWLQGSALT